MIYITFVSHFPRPSISLFNGFVMGFIRVWLTIVCSSVILVSAIDAPLNESVMCHPCPKPCQCTLLDDNTCSVDCSAKGLIVFPSDLPNDGKTLILNLSSNSLRDLQIHHLAHLLQLKSISLNNNSWRCGCTTHWSSQWLEKKAKDGLYIESSSTTRCHEPSNLNGVQLMDTSSLPLLCQTSLNFISCLKVGDDQHLMKVDYLVRSSGFHLVGDCDQFCLDQDFSVASFSRTDQTCSCGRLSSSGVPCSYDTASFSEPQEGSGHEGKLYLRNSHFVFSAFDFQSRELTGSSIDVTSVSIHLPVVPSHCVWSFGQTEGRLKKYGKSCQSADYRYVWPGTYRITAELVSVNDSVHVSGDTLISIQDPIIASVSPFSANVTSDEHLNLTIKIYSGTNISIFWNITNDSGTQERGTTDVSVTVAKYVTGVSSFVPFIDQIVSVSERNVPTSTPNGTTLYLFPGWSFSLSGSILKWIFNRNHSVDSQTLIFQIYRPYCSNNSYNVSPPGTEAEFSVCSNANHSTKPESNCSSDLQYCSLSMTCLPKQSPCTCHASVAETSKLCRNIRADNHTTSRESEFSELLPNYILIGSWAVESTTEVETGHEFSTDGFEVEKNDIVGLQFNSKFPPVNCIQGDKSPLRQSVIAVHRDSWVKRNANVSASFLVKQADWIHDLVCDVMAVYTAPIFFRLSPSSVLSSGRNTISVRLSNSVSQQTLSAEMKAVPEIKDFKLLYPEQYVIWPPLTNTSKTLAVEANNGQMFVFSVKAGSSAYLVNSFDSSVTLFAQGCPSDVPVKLECSNSDSYAVKKITFSASHNQSGFQVIFKAVNDVSNSSLVFDILAVMQIKDVCLTSNVSQVWPPYQDALRFSVASSNGNFISYKWTTSDKHQAVSLLPQLIHVFYHAGRHTVSVNVSNALSFQMSVLELTLYQLSNVNISRLEFPDNVVTGTLVTGNALLKMEPYSVVECLFRVNLILVKTVTIVNSNNQTGADGQINVTFSFSALNPGIHNVVLIAADLLLYSESHSNASQVVTSTAVNVEDLITGLHLNFETSFSNKHTFYFIASMVTGSNVTFTFVIDQNIVINSSDASLTYTFANAGPHTVSASASNRVSRSSTNLSVYIDGGDASHAAERRDDSTNGGQGNDSFYQPVEGLGLIGCCSEVFSTRTNISFALKVEKGSLQSLGCSWWIFNQADVVWYFQGYYMTFIVQLPGTYSLKVEANNLRNSQILADRFTVQEPISFLYIYTNAGFEGIFIHQELICTAMHATGSQMIYQWNITTQSGKFEIKEIIGSKMTAVFFSNETYEVHVFVKNNVSNASASAVVRALVCNPPELQLVGSRMRQEMRSQRIAIEVIVQSCVFYEAAHKWLVYRGNCTTATDRVPLPSSVTTDTPALHLPPRTLAYGAYCLHFSSEYVKTVNRSEILVDLAIVTSPLKALIFGGDERALTVKENIFLDGTHSYDPDVDEDDPSEIAYSWSCQSSPQVLENMCFPPSNKSVYVLSPNTFRENQTYVISLSIGSLKGSRVMPASPSTAVQKIHGRSAAVPQVSINCISCRDTNLFAIIHSQVIKLVGNCVGGSCEKNDEYSWSVIRNDSQKLPLNAATTTTGGNKKNLVIRGFVLNCNYSYTFTLYVTSIVHSVVGFSSIVLQPLIAPKNGSCKVHIPTSGVVVALVNPVIVTCTGWTDDTSSTSQLEYHIYVNETRAVNPRWYPIYRGPRGNVTFYMSPFQNLTELVELSIQVIDSERSLTKAVSQLVNVTSPPSRMEFLTSLIYEELEQEINHNDPRQIVPRIIAILLQLNSESRVGNTSEVAKQKREDMRSELLTYLNKTMTIGAIQDMQQTAFAMKLVTDVRNEFPNYPVHFCFVLRTLENIMELMQPYISQGLQGDEFVPSYLLDTASNLIDIMYFLDNNGESIFNSNNSGHRTIIEMTTSIIDQIMIVLFQTKVAEEEPIGFYTTSVYSWGQRVSIENIQPVYTGPGAVVTFPQLFSSTSEKVELFQYVSTFSYNPYQWGYTETMPITTRVVTVSLFDTFGNVVKIPAFSGSDEIELSVKMAEDVPSETEDGYLTTFDQVTTEMYSKRSDHLRNSSETLPSSDNETDLDLSVLPLQSVSTLVTLSLSNFTSLGLHINALVDTTNVSVASLGNVTVQVYVGQDYVPHKYKSDYSFEMILHQVFNGCLHDQQFKFLPQNSVKDSAGKFYLTFVNDAVTVSVAIKLRFFVISCKYFNKSNGLWDENGCRPINATSTWTTCSCSHMTTFGASSIPVPAAIKFVPLSGAVFSGNPVVIVTVLIALMVFVGGLVLMCYWDQLDGMRAVTMPLCGKDGPFWYEVLVFTGKMFGSGTTSNVGIQIFGENDRSNRVHLFHPGSFRRNAQDRFIIASPSALGPICKLQIWHDNSGSHPGWDLARISIRDIQTDIVYHFLADCFLSLDSSVGEIEKTLTVADDVALSDFCKKFNLDSFYRFSEQHLWFSVFDCCSWKQFGHSFRMTCCSLSTFCILAFCVIFYGLIEKRSEREELLGESAFRSSDSVLVFVSSAISFSLSSLLLEIFRLCKQKPMIPKERSRRSSKSVTIEMDDMTGGSHLGYRSLSVGSHIMNVLNPLELLELDIDNISDTSSFQLPLPKQLHRTAVMSNAKNARTQVDAVEQKSRQHFKKLMSKQPDDAHLWSSDMILHSWPDAINSGYDDNDDLSLNETLPASNEEISRKHLKLSVDDKVLKNPNFTMSSSVDCALEKKPIDRSVNKDCNQSAPRREPYYDSGIVLSDNVDCSSADNISVYTIPFHDVSDQQTSVNQVNTSLHSINISKKSVEEKYSLPHWVSGMTWSLCISLLCGSSILTLVVGHRFSMDVSLRWLTVSVVAVVLSAVVFETLKTLLMSLVVALKVKTINLDGYQISQKLLLESNEQFRHVKIRPIGGFALQKAKEEAKKFQTVRYLFRNFIIYSIFLVIVFAICYAPNDGDTAFFFSKSINDVMEQTKSNVSNDQSLDGVHCADDYWEWLESIFIGQIYINSSGWNKSTNHHHLLGPSRLRQLRSKEVPCLMGEKYGNSVWSADGICYGNPGWQEDTSIYSPGWIPVPPDSNDTWEYKTASGLSSVPYGGVLGWYDGGGYVQILLPSYNEALKAVNELRLNNWINEGTRVVMLEFTIYCSNIDLFASVIVALEFGLTGDIYTSQSIFVFHPLIYNSSRATVLIILEAVLACFMLYFTSVIIHSAWKSCSKFFTNMWSYWDISIVWLSSLSVILFAIIVTNDTSSYQDLSAHGGTVFVDFHQLGMLHCIWNYVNAFLLIFVLVLALKQLRFVKFLAAFSLTLRISCCVTFCCAFIFTLVLITYSLTGNLWLGSELSQFLTVGSAALTLVGVIRGESQTLAEMAENHLWFSIFFIVTFLWAMLFGVYNLSVASFVRTYKKTRKQINYHSAVKPHDHEIISFIMKQLKKYLRKSSSSKAAFRRVRFQDCSTISSVASSQSLVSDNIANEAEEFSTNADSQNLPEDDSDDSTSLNSVAVENSSTDSEDDLPVFDVSACNQILERLDRIIRLDDELNSSLIDKLQKFVEQRIHPSRSALHQRHHRTLHNTEASTSQTKMPSQPDVETVCRNVTFADDDVVYSPPDFRNKQNQIQLQKTENPCSKKSLSVFAAESWV